MSKLNYIFRSLIRHKLNSGVIVLSLSIGIACISLIAVFISRELNTDRFHADNELIYTLRADDPFREGEFMYFIRSGAAEYMKDNFEQVRDFCRFDNAGAPFKVDVENESFFNRPLSIAASGNFFEFFSYELLSGNIQSVLDTENCLVISEELAYKYFGLSDPAGKFISLGHRDKEEQMVITGVFRKPVENSQFNFDMVRLIGEEKDSRCFVRLSQQADPEELEKQFDANREAIPIVHAGTPGQYYLSTLRDGYFDTSRNMSVWGSRDKTDLWIALVIGLMIIGIAVFNYIGLINNSLIWKTNEYKIRRINGASTKGLIFSFTAENLVLIIVSFVISLYVITYIAPFFNRITGTAITTAFLLRGGQILILLSVVVFLVLITVLFAFFRLRLNRVRNTLKPVNQRAGKGVYLPAFNIVQLAGSLILIISSIVIIRQMIYITERPIGLDRDVIEVKIMPQHSDLVHVFKEELEKMAPVDMVSVANASPVLEYYMVLLQYEEDGIERQFTPAGFTGDENFVPTLGLRLLAGDGFTGNPSSDRNRCLINESFAGLFPERDLIGRGMPGMEDVVIAGIVEDFHYLSLKSHIEPAYINFDTGGNHLLVKPKENQSPSTRDAISQLWAELIPGYPENMESIGERYDWMHRENRNYLLLIGSCCSVSIFLSMIGLFAISFYSSRYRTKEIGIRKVNGAKIREVVALLNYDYIKWVAIAFILATPVAWYAMNRWLHNFAYQTELSWWIFALAGLIALGIALLTVSWQSWRAARRNPVEALRYE
ncbi:MAG: FtsX-like permease family protein [Bacteroidales bacterium]